MRIILFAQFMFFVVLVSGCGGDDGSGEEKGNEFTALQGTWIADCTETDTVDVFHNTKVVIAGNTYVATFTAYTDAACTEVRVTDGITDSGTESGTLVIGDSLTTGSGFAAKELDAHASKRNGIVMGAVDIDYDIYSIVDGVLYLGDDASGAKDGTTPANRPVDLLFSQVFRKVNLNDYAEMQGRWRTGCVATGSSGNYVRSIMVIRDIAYIVTTGAYTDAACTAPVVPSNTFSISGVYVTGNALTTGSGLAAKELDAYIIRVDDVKLDVIGLQYDLYSVIEGELYFGDSSGAYDGSSPEKRPVDLLFSESLSSFVIK